MTTEEKKRLGTTLTRLSADDLNKSLLIVAQNNPSFQVTAEVVDLDMDAQVIICLPQYSNLIFFMQIKYEGWRLDHQFDLPRERKII